MKKMSRLEANKEVRRCLNRNSVDLSYCQFSVAGRDIRMTGWLQKVDSSHFNAHQIETLILEFQRHLPGYTVSGEMDNWHFTTDHINYLGEAKASRKGQHEVEVNVEDDSMDYDSEAS